MGVGCAVRGPRVAGRETDPSNHKMKASVISHSYLAPENRKNIDELKSDRQALLVR